jgi:hypothetical protein
VANRINVYTFMKCKGSIIIIIKIIIASTVALSVTLLPCISDVSVSTLIRDTEYPEVFVLLHPIK